MEKGAPIEDQDRPSPSLMVKEQKRQSAPVIKNNWTPSKAVAEEKQVTPKASAVEKKEPAAETPKISDDRLIWSAMLQAFETSPFVYDVMTNCSVRFEKDTWTISFGSGKEFYKVPAQTKLPELEKMALKLSGRKISFQIASEASPTSVKETKMGTNPAPKAEKTIAHAKESISQEEPFVKADFSADIEPEKTLQDVPEELQDILEVMGGEVLA